MTQSPVAELKNVTKTYGAIRALDCLDLEVRPGEVMALLGPNGAGKTTAVSLMVGLSSADQGEIRIFGRSPRHVASRRRTGVMLQVGGVPETLRVREHIDLFSRYYPDPLPREEVLAVAGLTDLAGRPYEKLSGGQQRRLQFALAICGRPQLLFLDEPTVGLDVESRRAFWEQIRGLVAAGTSIVLTTHYLEEADALADRIAVIDRGRLVALGSADEIKSRGQARRIRCQTTLERRFIENLPGVRSVHDGTQRLEILSDSVEDSVRALLTADQNLSHLEIEAARLEDAFLDLTREEQMEDAA